MGEIAESFCSDYALWPFPRNHVVELVEVERTALIIDECPDSIFLGFALVVMMMVVMMIVVVVIIVVVIVVAFDFGDPCG